MTSVAWRLQWWTTWRSCWQHQEVVTQTITRIIWLHIFGIILDSKCPFKEVLKLNSKHVWEWPKTTIYFTWRLYIERTFWWWWTMLQIRPWVCIYFCWNPRKKSRNLSEKSDHPWITNATHSKVFPKKTITVLNQILS